MKKEFYMTLPFAGAFRGVVEAENEEEAREIFTQLTSEISFDGDMLDKLTVDVEWDVFDHIVQGHVLYARFNNYTAEEIE